MARRRPSQALVPVTSLKDGLLTLADGSMRCVLECSTVALGLRDEAEQGALAQAWAAVLNSLEHPVQVVVSTRTALTVPGEPGAPGGDLRGELSRSYAELLGALSKDGAVVDRRFLMVVPGDAPLRPRPFGHHRNPEGADVAGILRQRADWMAAGLRRLGVEAVPLSSGAVTALLHRLLCPESAASPPEVNGAAVDDLARVVAPAAFSESPTEVRLGDRLARSHAVTSYPQLIQQAWIERLLAFEGEMDLSLHIQPAQSQAMMGFLGRRIAELSSTLRLNEERGRRPDAYRRAALDDATDLQDRLARGDQRLFGVSAYVTVWGRDRAELDAASTRLEALLGSMLLQSRRLILQMRPALIGSLPLCTDPVGLQRYLTTGVLAATFPFTGSDSSGGGGVMYGVGAESRAPVMLDNFALPNHNEVVFATSGAGKSYLAKLKLIRGWQRGIGFSVIDPEGEYAPVVEVLGGRVIRLHPGVPAGIDPFRLPHDEPGALSSRVATLITLVELLAGGLSANQRAAAEEAISFAYAARGFSDEHPDLSLQPPTLSDVRAALTRRLDRWLPGIRAEVEELAVRLDRYTQGAGRWLFAQAADG